METLGFSPEEARENNPQGGVFLESEKPVPAEAEKIKPMDALIVLGSNIREDARLEQIGYLKPELMQTPAGNSRLRLPIPAKFRVIAAAELYLRGETSRIILSGGETKKEKGVEESEAVLMKDYLEKTLRKRWRAETVKTDKDVSLEDLEAELNQRWAEVEPSILIEDKSVSTLQNFAHTANLIDQQAESPVDSDKIENCGILSNRFHVPRALLIAQKFKIKGIGIAAEDALSIYRHRSRLANRYFDLEGNNAYRESVLSALSEDEEAKKVAEIKLGMSMEKYEAGEQYGMNVLNNVPGYWLPDVQYIENPERMRQILTAGEDVKKKINEELAKNNIDGDIDSVSDEELRAVTQSIVRETP